ncbi:MAG TPA: choice-of-anchor D domain-containing protein [Myxococcales bacterium]|nr:choice-of-anchor D domain-containing protein [Myxococcales bacterium]
MKRAAFALVALAACQQTHIQSAQPSLQVSPTSLDFGSSPVLTSSSMTVTLTNVGQADLDVSSVTVSSGDGAFALQGTAPTLVAGGGGTQTLTIVFTPPAEQSYEDTVTIASDDPAHPTVTVPLTGVGSTEGQLTVSPDPVDFGQVGEGSTSLQQLTLSSVGTAPLVISSITLADGGDPSFTFASSAKAGTLPNTPPDNTAALTLRFSPTAATPLNPQSAVIIDSNDPSQPELSVPLTAQVIEAPFCELADPGTVAVGAAVTLDGGASYDPGGNLPLSYQWAMTTKPAGSNAALANVQGAYPNLVADEPGSYAFSLGVTNSLGIASVQPCTATLTARPADDLYVEMIWDNLPVDMDLHFLAQGGLLGSTALDCNGNNQDPTGFAATCSDDHLTGPGPEWAEDASPASGTYTIDVVYFSTHGVASTACNVTVRVYEYGVVTGVFTQQLTAAGQLWQVATVDWPSGAITALGTVSG